MRVRAGRLLATGTILTLVPLLLLSRSAAWQPQKPRAADKPPDLAHFLELGRYLVAPVEPKKDARTGFVVGGKNDTALVRGLKEINGRAIAELEKDMRPGAKSEVGSTAGFLGPDEKLLDVLAADNRYVVDERGLTHQELAKHLHAIGSIGRWQVWQHRRFEYEFVYHGRRFKATTLISRGFQPSPFRDGTQSGTDVTVENLDTGKKLKYGLLVPYMIERYGFYEGKGTSYRVEPSKVLEVFDFLQKKEKKR
jgi:hypothetical protein